MGLVTVAIFVFLALSLVVPWYLQHPHALWLPLGAYGLLLFFALFVFVGSTLYTGNAKAAVWVEVNDTGIVFGFAGKRARTLLWDDHRFYLAVERKEGLVRSGIRGPPLLDARTRPFRHLGFLTPEAVDAILTKARQRGMTVTGGIPGKYGSVVTVVTPH